MKKKIISILIFLILIVIIILSICFLKRISIKENAFSNLNNYQEENYNDYLIYYNNNSNIDKQDIVNFINYCIQNSIDCNQKSELIDLYNIE